MIRHHAISVNREIVLCGCSEQSAQICTQHLAGGDCGRYRTQYDSGTVSMTVNGILVSTTYGTGTIGSSIASALAGALNSNGSSGVTASVNGATIVLTAITAGGGTNYPLSATSSTNYPADFDGPSFYATPSGSALLGGTDAGTLGHLLTSVVVDGSASMTIDPNSCPYPYYENMESELPYDTHTPSAYNVVNGVGGWQQGTSECVTCYLSVQTIEDSGSVTLELPTTFSSGGEVDCSVGGPIFAPPITSQPFPGCLVPSTEETDDIGWNGGIDREQFDMTLSDAAADNFDNHYVQEYTVMPGTNTCWWSTSGLIQNPGTQNSYWTVGTVNGSPEHNHWGYDEIGWDLVDLDNIVQNGPAHGVIFPCTITIYQGMLIECDANTWWGYRTDVLTITVDNSPENDETNCRDKAADPDNCGLPVNFSYRKGEQPTWWAHIRKVPARSSPQWAPAKEAR